MSYFSKFKLAQYGDVFCRNIVSRSSLTQTALKTTALYHPFVAKAGERPDTLSFHYYRVPEYDWLLFFANEIVDPYYQWYLTDEQFNSVIREKYGSLPRAQLRIRHYETNWISDNAKISLAAYAALPNGTKKYWAPVVDQYDNPIAYSRRREVLKSNTNKYLKINLSGTTANFNTDEDIYQIVNNTITASATIDVINEHDLIVKHIRGNFDIAYNIIGGDSETASGITNVQTLSNVIPANEQIYWTPVTYYEYEMQINENNKLLKIMDERYVEQAEQNLKSLMR